MNILSINKEINGFFGQFEAKKAQKARFLGLGRFGFVFSQDQTGPSGVNLVKKISESIKKGQSGVFTHKDYQDKINHLFFDIVPTLSAEARSKIYKEIGDNKALQNYLSPEIKKLREEKKSRIDDQEHRLNRKIAKARFALKLGMQKEKVGTGCSGSYFLKSINGKRVGLLKPSNTKQSLKRKVVNLFKRVFRFQNYFLSGSPKAGVQSEKAAYIVSYKGGFGTLVPPTTLETMDGIEGSFMLMAKPAPGNKICEFKQIQNEFNQRKNFSPEEIIEFQKLGVYDYLINNLDCHDRNWLVEYKVENGIKKLVKIHAIDHDRAFAKGNPSWIDKFGSHSQYKWRETTIAKEAMTDETKNFIKTNITEEKVRDLINDINSKIPGFLTTEMQDRMIEKSRVLNKMASDPQLNSQTFADLGNLRTDRSIREFLS